MTDARDDLLAGWRAPSVPPGLEQRVLAAAMDPLARPTPRRIEDRLWESRTLRYGWLAAASALLALHLVIADPAGRGVDRPSAVAAAQEADDLDIGMELPAHRDQAMTLADAHRMALALLNDPCLDPSLEGDCT